MTRVGTDVKGAQGAGGLTLASQQMPKRSEYLKWNSLERESDWDETGANHGSGFRIRSPSSIEGNKDARNHCQNFWITLEG